MCQTIAAHGPASVCSTGKGARPECHAPSGYRVNDYSGANGARDRMRDMVLAFWESQGVAVWRNGGAGGGGRWFVRDMVNGGADFLPLASRADVLNETEGVAEFSHVRSAENGGAWCACNLLPEAADRNRAREGADMTTLSPAARAVLGAWPAWWTANVARKASLKRLSA